MRITASTVLAIMCLCIVMFTATGCANIIGGIIDTAIDAIPDTQTPIFGKKERFVPKPNIDTKETIIKGLGKPSKIIVIDSNKEVLAYSLSFTARLYALKNGVYQDTYLTYSDEVEKFSKSELVQIFPCFRETAVASYTPQEGHTLTQVVEGMGRPWTDRFELKDENGDRMENNIIVAYDLGNGKLLVIGLIDDEVTKVKEFPIYAYYTYRQEVAYSMVAEVQ